METTLRSVRRRVGHTHGWLRTLGKAEEERKGNEEGGGERQFQRLLWDSSRRSIELKKTHANLMSFSFLVLLLSHSRMCSSYIRQEPIRLGGAHDCDGPLEKDSSASIFIIRLMEQ